MKSPNSFLEQLSPEVEDVLTWFRGYAESRPVPVNMEKFAGGFLFQLLNDGALVPILKMQPAKLLGLVLTHHEKDPDDPVAWLNLGFAYRRIALYRASDPPKVNNRRIELALSSFERSLKLERKNAKAWIGRGLVFLQQKADFDQAAPCFRKALDIDPTGPLAWLFYSTALESAGRTEAALAAVDSAVDYYQRLDKETASKLPEEFRSVLDEYQALRAFQSERSRARKCPSS